GGHLAQLAPGVGEKAQRPRGGHLGIELAKRAGSGVARVGEDGAAGGGLLLIELEKRGARHIDLAANLAYLGQRCSATAHLRRDVADAVDVGGDVLAFRAVTASRTADQRTALVA